ncbi:MAG: c-type cytochrome [Terriglobales bacterium]
MTRFLFFCRVVSCSSFFAFVLTVSSFAGNDPKADAGGNIFKSHCILCHGLDATGKTTLGKQLKAKNLRSAAVQRKSDAELKQIITGGEGKMPTFADQLSSSQIDELVAYVRQLGKAKK